MARFLDGPAEGAILSFERLPMYLRVVVKIPGAPSPTIDVLDQEDDTPADNEVVVVYRRVAGTLTSPIYVCRPTRGRGGRFQDCDYEHMPEIDGEQLRETEAWREWAMGQPVIE